MDVNAPLTEATALLQNGPILVTRWIRFHVPILRQICEVYNIPVASTHGKKGVPIKKDYAEALHQYVSALVSFAVKTDGKYSESPANIP